MLKANFIESAGVITFLNCFTPVENRLKFGTMPYSCNLCVAQELPLYSFLCIKAMPVYNMHLYYSFEIFRCFWLAPFPWLILHNQLALTIFGRCKQYTIDSMVYLIRNNAGITVVKKFWSRWLSCQSKWPVHWHFIWKTPSVKKCQGTDTNQIGGDFCQQPATFDEPCGIIIWVEMRLLGCSELKNGIRGYSKTKSLNFWLKPEWKKFKNMQNILLDGCYLLFEEYLQRLYREAVPRNKPKFWQKSTKG